MQKLEQLILPFVLLLSVLAIRVGNATECYNCDSSINPECSDIKKTSSLKPVTCKPVSIGENVGDWLKEITRIDFFENADVSVLMVCQKIVAKNEKNEVITFRGCQLDGGKTDVCETVKTKAKKSNVEIESCNICSDDGCNKSTSLRIINLWLLLAPLILVNFFV